MAHRIVMLGPPAAGKGTQAARLAQELGIPHVDSGELLREQASAGTELGRSAKARMDAGELVPDDVMIGLVLEQLTHPEAAGGWVLDGFPRDVRQASELSERLRPSTEALAIELRLPDDEILRRIGGRRVCPHGHTYHLIANPPRKQGVCDLDGLPLNQRADDREDVTRRRIAIYHEESAPLVNFYRAKGILESVDGSGTPEETYARVLQTARRQPP